MVVEIPMSANERRPVEVVVVVAVVALVVIKPKMAKWSSTQLDCYLQLMRLLQKVVGLSHRPRRPRNLQGN